MNVLAKWKLTASRVLLLGAIAVLPLACDDGGGGESAGDTDPSDMVGDAGDTGLDTTSVADGTDAVDTDAPCGGTCSDAEVCTMLDDDEEACRCLPGLVGPECRDPGDTFVEVVGATGCALDASGARTCWGGADRLDAFGIPGVANSPSPTTGPESVEWRTLAFGPLSERCGLDTDGKVWCWGFLWTDEAPDGLEPLQTEVDVPTRTGFELQLRTLSAGREHYCGIQDDGDAWCWGRMQPFGKSTEANRWTLTPVQLDGKWLAIDAGYDSTCGVQDDGRLYCFGSTETLAHPGGVDDEVIETPEPVFTATDWRTVDIGLFTGCAVTLGGDLYCWGQNRDGQVGAGPATDDPLPFSQVGDDQVWADVAAGDRTTCGLQVDGSLWCWGLDPSSSTTSLGGTPIRIGDRSWSEVTIESGLVCAANAEREWECWGTNEYGQLGSGWWSFVAEPAPVADGTFESLTVGGTQACGVRSDGSLGCWGARTRPTAEGNYAFAAEPVDFPAAERGWLDVAMQRLDLRCAIADDTTRWCWGDTGGVGFVEEPEAAGDRDWADLTGGWDHSCGIKTDGTLWCWGEGSDGQLGDGSSANAQAPVQVGTATDWTDVGPANRFTCGIRAGELWCWGSGPSGELGDPQITESPTPIRVGTDADWTEIEATWRRACAIKAGGELWCWGDDISAAGPVRVGTDTGWTDVAIADALVRFSLCGVRSGELHCWRLRTEPVDFDNSDVLTTPPTRLGAAATWVSVDGEDEVFCARQTDGSTHCFGHSPRGILGQSEFVAPLPLMP